MRMLKLPFGLADEVIDLRSGDARDLVFDRGQTARADRQFSLAV